MGFTSEGGFFCVLSIEGGIVRVEILAVRLILCDAEGLAEALEMGHFSLTEEFDRLSHIGIIHKTQDIVVGDTRLLLCCNCISTTFLEIPMNFYGNITRTGYSFTDGYIINQRFHDLAR